LHAIARQRNLLSWTSVSVCLLFLSHFSPFPLSKSYSKLDEFRGAGQRHIAERNGEDALNIGILTISA
jgi:hypothetical protein